MSCKYNNCKHCGYKSECEIYKENAELKELNEGYCRNRDRLVSIGFPNFKDCKEYAEKLKELEKQISILLSCKDCPENKGGYICEKEYNDKCLAQKIQYIKELKEEHKQNEIDLIISNSSARAELNEQLAQAKEIIALGLRVCETSSVEYMNWYQKRAEQFLSEVEK